MTRPSGDELSPPPSPFPVLDDSARGIQQSSEQSVLSALSSEQREAGFTENTVSPTCKPPNKPRRRDNDADDDGSSAASVANHTHLLTAADIERRLCNPRIFTLPAGDAELITTARSHNKVQNTGLARAKFDIRRAIGNKPRDDSNRIYKRGTSDQRQTPRCVVATATKIVSRTTHHRCRRCRRGVCGRCLISIMCE